MLNNKNKKIHRDILFIHSMYSYRNNIDYGLKDTNVSRKKKLNLSIDTNKFLIQFEKYID